MAQPRGARKRLIVAPENRESKQPAQQTVDRSQDTDQDRVESVGTASRRDVSPNTPRGEPV